IRMVFLRRVFPVNSRRAQHQFHRLREVSYPVHNKQPNFVSVQEALKDIQSGASIFVGGSSSSPTPLLVGLHEEAERRDLKGISLHHIHLHGPSPWSAEGSSGRVRSNALFLGGGQNKDVNAGRVDFVPIFLTDVAKMFYRKRVPLDAAFVTVSPPDERGFCSLGTSVDCVRSAVTMAPRLIGVVSKNMPRTHGESLVHASHFHALVRDDTHQLYERKMGSMGEAELKIGKLIAENLVDDGSTMQMGVGDVPDATLAALSSHKDLGIHTEMISDGVMQLIENNVITNRLKTTMPGKVVTSFAYGTRKLYDFLDNNPLFHFAGVEWTNDPRVIAAQRQMIAINSFVEIDITGQVCSDSIGRRLLSGFGGQVDFIYGASIADDGLGKPIMAAPSTNKKSGESKIVSQLKPGAGVVTSRAHVHYVVTEYGIANLWGRNVRQRAFDLIRIAHPTHRERLEKEAFERLGCLPSNE
ncbi:hypothetical protein PFISCL1PPCAC_2606, partial [Pristionchus fissidentatus]